MEKHGEIREHDAPDVILQSHERPQLIESAAAFRHWKWKHPI
jgi:hypothetical protein